MSILSNAWRSICARKEQPLTLRDAPRAYFPVADPRAARILKNWAESRIQAADIITAYLRKASPVLGAETPNYKVDENGRVTSINFLYAIGLTHEGWRGIPGTNWLVPETDTVKRDIDALPRLPPFDPVIDLLKWPTICTSKLQRDQHLPGFGEFARRANSQIHVTPRNEQVYVSVPFPAAFRDYPKMADQVQAWRPPPGFTQIDAHTGRRLERAHDFGQSPLGRGLAKIRHKTMMMRP